MKNCIVFILLILTHFALHAQDYKITFAGTGASTIVDSVEVENINTGAVLVLAGNQVLHLVGEGVGVSNFMYNDNGEIKIFPNPLNESSTIEFALPASGKVNVEIYNLPGRKLVSTSSEMNAGLHSFILKGLGKGVYSIRVYTSKFSCTGKFISNSPSGSKPEISYNGFQELSFTPANLKSAKADVVMQYKKGDRLKITGKSGIYKTVLNDVPNQSKELKIPFIQCTDADGNNYSVVKIGDQYWMGENLKTSIYNDGTPIPNVTDSIQWCSLTTGAYCNYNNLESNSEIYGRLYNWYAVNTGKLAPAGWHIPTDKDCYILHDYLTANGYNYDGTKEGNKFSKSLCAKTNWKSSEFEGTPGNAPENNNSTGFTAFPAGHRYEGKGGAFRNIGTSGYWWASDEFNIYTATSQLLASDYEEMFNYVKSKKDGLSVRFIKD